MKIFTIGLKLFSFGLLTTFSVPSLFAVEEVDAIEVGNFKVTFHKGNEGGTPEDDIAWTTEQKDAVYRALQTWNNTIITDYDSNFTNLFNVDFYLKSLGDASLASAGASTSAFSSGGMVKLRSAIEAVWRDGENYAAWQGANVASVNVNMDKFKSAYWGASATGITLEQIDFESVLLHEMGHVMGISSYLIPDPAGSNSLSMRTSGSSSIYTTFDSKIQRADGAYLIDLESGLTDNLATTGDLLYIDGVQLYNPEEYQFGSSLSHINAGDNGYDDLRASSAVMKYANPGNQVLREFSEQDLTILRAIGWDVIPEPSTASLFAGAVVFALVGGRKRRK